MCLRDVLGCDIETNTGRGWSEPVRKMILKVGWNDSDLNNFLNNLNFDYNRYWGAQEFYGYIWMNDGTWFERNINGESENWEYKKCPDIPKVLEEVN